MSPSNLRRNKLARRFPSEPVWSPLPGKRDRFARRFGFGERDRERGQNRTSARTPHPIPLPETLCVPRSVSISGRGDQTGPIIGRVVFLACFVFGSFDL